MVIDLPKELSQEMRLKIWDLLEAHARIGNLKPGSIAGGGLPDLLYEWIKEFILSKMDTPVRIDSRQWNLMNETERAAWLKSWGLLDTWEAKMTGALTICM